MIRSISRTRIFIASVPVVIALTAAAAQAADTAKPPAPFEPKAAASDPARLRDYVADLRGRLRQHELDRDGDHDRDDEHHHRHHRSSP
jgi:hypothetical protein